MKRILQLGLLSMATTAAGAEFSGNLAVEGQVFNTPPQFSEQFDNNVTLSFEPRWNGEWNGGDDLWSVQLFMRADHKDEGREHADLREALWLHIDGDNEWRVGVNTMFWGVTESRHLVDVVNQTDAVENIDGEDKLGQPMIHLKRYEDWGVLDFLVLPGFRERTFHAAEGRLRPPLVVDDSQTAYESSAGQQHVDYAFRISQTWDDLDLGLSLFKGTSRDPLLLPGFDANGNPVLTPYYEQMTQLGIDMQFIYLDWIWKLEAIRREAESSDFNAFTGGFEYTFYGIFDSATDLGAIVEYSRDSRPKAEATILDNDVFVGGRFAFNDIKSSEILAGFFVDADNRSRSFRVEASRRIGDSWKGTLELQTFANIAADDPLAAIDNDDFLRLEMAYYF